MEWTLAGTVTCDAPVGIPDVNISPPGGDKHEFIQGLVLEKRRTVRGKRSAVASQLGIKLRFEAPGPQEAHDRGTRGAQEVTAALAFLVSAAAEIQIGSITSAHAPVSGTEYTMLQYPLDRKSGIPLVTVPTKDAAFLIQPKPERVLRALRWIHKSHSADSHLDEFTCLMVAFESLSQLLKQGDTRYWHCPKCDRDITLCPECGESTGSRMSGEDAMREFVVQKLGWRKKDWAAAWGWRCRLLHGEADISAEEEHAVLPLLPALEAAVIAATKTVAGLAPGNSPTRGRYRAPFSEAVLELSLRVG